MKKIIAIIAAIAAAGSAAFAQSTTTTKVEKPDSVTVVSTPEGLSVTISGSKENPTYSYTTSIESGNVRSHHTSTVDFFSEAAAEMASRLPLYRKGYVADVEFGAAVAVKSPMAYTFSTTHGYSLGNGLMIGGGIGLNVEDWHYYYADWYTYNHTFTVPVYLATKYSFLNRKVSPYVALKGGFVVDIAKMAVGHFFRPAAGIDWKNFSFAINYDWNMIVYSDYHAAFGRNFTTLSVSYNF
ncbi:MAG: hypothetical protein MJY97_07340 [Bacteroidales bacterium]|nr:hypothetical protein [Bacteroidales bacterium]